MDKIYDVIILGAGPGGLAAGIYAGRARLDTLLIEKGKDGGQIAITDEIENYPGQMVDGESGPSLIERMTKQVEKFGAERVSDTIVSVDIEGPVKTLVGSNGTYKARTLIIATGAFPRPIGCKGEGEFMGKGVSYCATCDASFFEDLEVFVVGGGDSAVEEAMYLTKFARKVTVIHRRDELRAAKSIQERAFKNPKLFFMWDTVVEELHGDGILSGMTVKNVKTGELTRIVQTKTTACSAYSASSDTTQEANCSKASWRWTADTSRPTKTCIPMWKACTQLAISRCKELKTGCYCCCRRSNRFHAG